MEAKFSIIGHAEHLKLFNQLLAEKRVPSAILLSGPPMTGKMTLLQYLARHLLCLKQAECGSCRSCSLTLASHPDVIHHQFSKGQSPREQMVGLLSRVYEQPVCAPRIVIFLEDLDRYSRDAKVLLLKALEDAPRYVHFLITAENEQYIPRTILSRTINRRVNPLAIENLKDSLVTLGISPERAQKLATLSGGRPGLAIRLEKDQELEQRYTKWYEILNHLPRLPLAERMLFAERVSQEGATNEILCLLQSMISNQIDLLFKKGNNNFASLCLWGRRTREAMAMLRANVPSYLVLEYVFFS